MGDQSCRKAATYTQGNINIGETRIHVHASSGIRTHDPSVERAKTFHASDRAVIACEKLKVLNKQMLTFLRRWQHNAVEYIYSIYEQINLENKTVLYGAYEINH
jgi:hypothetical protein